MSFVFEGCAVRCLLSVCLCFTRLAPRSPWFPRPRFILSPQLYQYQYIELYTTKTLFLQWYVNLLFDKCANLRKNSMGHITIFPELKFRFVSASNDLRSKKYKPGLYLCGKDLISQATAPHAHRTAHEAQTNTPLTIPNNGMWFLTSTRPRRANTTDDRHA